MTEKFEIFYIPNWYDRNVLKFPSDIRHYLIRHLQYVIFFYKIDHQSGWRFFFNKNCLLFLEGTYSSSTKKKEKKVS